MNWSSLVSQSLNIQWSAKLGLCLDPYLVWADITRFTGLQAAMVRSGMVAANASVPIAFELVSGLSAKSLGQKVKALGLAVPWVPVLLGPRFGTITVPIAFLRTLLSPLGQSFVRRFELGLPTKAPNNAALYSQLLTGSVSKSQPGLKGAAKRLYAAVIDDGCAFAHEAFLVDPKVSWPASRIERLWFQEDKDPIDPNTLGYTAQNLQKWFLKPAVTGKVLDEGRAYRLMRDHLRNARKNPELARAWERQMRTPATHGTHILDVMAGAPNPLASSRYRYGEPNDAAAKAPILFVQLPRAAVADTSGASMNCNVLEALAFVASVVKAPNEVVVNLSYGALAGPHDGTSLLEEAVDHFLNRNPHVKALTLPAGNGYDSSTHARLRATRDGRWHEMNFRVLPGDPTDTFIELWYAPTADATPGRAVLEFEVIAPDGTRSGPVALGQGLQWGNTGQLPVAALVHLERPTAGGGKKHMALLAIAPTQPNKAQRRLAPHGDWRLRVRNRGGYACVVDAWIERDDSAFGSGRARGQARFLSEGHSPARGMAHAATFPIERQMSLNSFAHGLGPKVAGGYSLRSVGGSALDPRQSLARYSASGPGRKGEWSGPDVCAPCEERPGVGILAAGTRSVQPVYLDGTSVASAALGRQCINAGDRPLPCPDEDDLNPVRPHPDGIAYPDPVYRRGRGRLKPMP